MLTRVKLFGIWRRETKQRKRLHPQAASAAAAFHPTRMDRRRQRLPRRAQLNRPYQLVSIGVSK
jgi:hypothetical protein